MKRKSNVWWKYRLLRLPIACALNYYAIKKNPKNRKFPKPIGFGKSQKYVNFIIPKMKRKSNGWCKYRLLRLLIACEFHYYIGFGKSQKYVNFIIPKMKRKSNGWWKYRLLRLLIVFEFHYYTIIKNPKNRKFPKPIGFGKSQKYVNFIIPKMKRKSNGWCKYRLLRLLIVCEFHY